jgi:hypothetical protein
MIQLSQLVMRIPLNVLITTRMEKRIQEVDHLGMSKVTIFPIQKQKGHTQPLELERAERVITLKGPRLIKMESLRVEQT